MLRGLFIDDAEKDKDIGLLLKCDELEVIYWKPDSSLVELADKIFAFAPAFLALDYRLDEERVKEDAPNRYKAGPLAQHLRDNALEDIHKDFPIVLVSHEEKIKRDYTPDLTAHDLFDRFYSKQTIVANPDKCRKEILGLIYGYKSLVENWKASNHLETLLNVTENDAIEIEQHPLKDINALKAPHQVMRSFLRYFIDRPGLFWDVNNLSAQLGIEFGSQDLDPIYQVLNNGNTRYSGPLAAGWLRWWSHRVNILMHDICGSNYINFSAEQRVDCLNHLLNLNLSPAKSRWTGMSNVIFTFSCASCAKPTEREHSVAAYDPFPYPSLALKKRICWKCVQTGEFENASPPLTIHEDDHFIAEKIQSGEITGEA